MEAIGSAAVRIASRIQKTKDILLEGKMQKTVEEERVKGKEEEEEVKEGEEEEGEEEDERNEESEDWNW